VKLGGARFCPGFRMPAMHGCAKSAVAGIRKLPGNRRCAAERVIVGVLEVNDLRMAHPAFEDRAAPPPRTAWR
jgi:hypothetical protein